MSLVPSGSERVSDMTRVWPADTDTGGISFLAADLGSVGALAGPEGFEGTESVQSMEMGNCAGERFRLGLKRSNEKAIAMSFFVTFYPNSSSFQDRFIAHTWTK